MKPIPYLAVALCAVALHPAAPPQVSATTEIPAFSALLAEPVSLHARLAEAHPRLFFDRDGLAALRRRAAEHPAAWDAFVAQASALREAPPEPPAQGRGQHYLVGLALPEPAFAYAITRDPRYLAQARRWIAAVLAYQPWGYTYSKPDQDIPAGHLLYGLAFAYDLLHDDLEPAERAAIAATLREKGTRLFEYYAPRPGRRYTFSQNHTFINATAVAMAAIVLGGQADTQPWLRWARAVFDRTLRTYSKDGYYYEGYHYFEFSVPWIVHYLDAMEFNTDERLYERTRLDLARLYVAHSLLGDGSSFDFGDTGRGTTDRRHGVKDTLGAHQILYRVASRLDDPASAAVAEWVSAHLGLPVREPVWRFIWRDPATVASLDSVPLVHHFEDAGVVFARTGWARGDVAFAFKAGPPEGHAAMRLAGALPEWRQNTGHAHPDAGSFIIAAGGRYLTGDAGYTGVKMTAHHNTLLVDGQGQARDGRHEVFKDVPQDRLDRIRISRVSATAGALVIEADLGAAYEPSLDVTSLTRTFTFDGRRTFTIVDRGRFATPRSLSILVQSDHPIVASGTHAFRLAPGWPTLDAEIDPGWPPAVVAARTVVAQGRPGSVEKGATEERGTTLRIDLAPARAVEATWRLRLRDAELPLSPPARGRTPSSAPAHVGPILRQEQP